MDPLHQWFAEAFLLQKEGNASGAVMAWRRVLSRHPEVQDGWINLAQSLRRLGRGEEARQALERAEATGAETPPLLSLRAALAAEEGRLESALADQLRAVELAPADVETRMGLGPIYHRLGRSEAALAADEAVLQMTPDLPAGLINRSASLLRLQRTAEAIQDCRRAVALAPEEPLAHLNLGVALLLEGQLEEGFREYEWRWKAEEVRAFDPRFEEPRWRGEPFAGKTLLLWAEQGMGDTLMALRGVRAARALGGKVVLAVQPALVDLAKQTGADVVLPEDQPLPPFDIQAPLMSLFSLLPGVALSRVPYLRPSPAGRAADIEARLAALPDPKVGLVWQGNPFHRDDAYRRLDPALLAPLASIPHLSWVSLQKWEGGPPDRRPPLPMADLGDLLETFADTAYALSRLDLLISIDTSVLHLAGAMGRPALALLSHAPDWRWQLHRLDSPWYPTLTLVRQPGPGDWAGLVAHLRDVLT